MMRAESETKPSAAEGRSARDLSTNRIVDATELVAGSPSVRERFSDARWEAFRRDVDSLETELGSRWQNVYLDHGYNPTPVWALAGGLLANRVEAGNRDSIFRLTLVDPVLLGLSALAIAWAFGAEAALLAIAYYGIVYGASFAWIGGAYLRSLWFCLTTVAVCCLRRGLPAAAGGFVASASLVQVFPIFFAVPIGLQGIAELWRTRRISSTTKRFFAGFAFTGTLLVLASCWVAPGFAAWSEFADNARVYMVNLAPNTIGLTSLATVLLGRLSTTVGDLPGELFTLRLGVQWLQWVVVLPLVVLGVGLLARRRKPHEAAALGAILIFASLSPAAYYFTFLVVVLVANVDHPERVAWLFAIEFLTYALDLFEPGSGVLYLYRSALVFWLFVLLAVDMAAERHEPDLEPA